MLFCWCYDFFVFYDIFCVLVVVLLFFSFVVFGFVGVMVWCVMMSIWSVVFVVMVWMMVVWMCIVMWMFVFGYFFYYWCVVVVECIVFVDLYFDVDDFVSCFCF